MWSVRWVLLHLQALSLNHIPIQVNRTFFLPNQRDLFFRIFFYLYTRPRYRAIVYQKQILCSCLPIDFVTTDDGELVCNCGIIQGENHDNVSSITSKTNLAQDYQLGGKRTGTFPCEKFINSSDSSLSEISNICHGLDLPSFVYHDVWAWYQKLSPILTMTKSKVVFSQFTHYADITISL